MKAGTDAIYDTTGKRYIYGRTFSTICKLFFLIIFITTLDLKLIGFWRNWLYMVVYQKMSGSISEVISVKNQTN